MKAFIKLTVLSALLSVVYGCASSGDKFETRVPPPDAINAIFMRYKELPGEKVFVVAVDPTGRWAFGYDVKRETLEEAARNAAIKCDDSRKKHGVFTKAKLFAVNNEVVYYNQY